MLSTHFHKKGSECTEGINHRPDLFTFRFPTPIYGEAVAVVRQSSPRGTAVHGSVRLQQTAVVGRAKRPR